MVGDPFADQRQAGESAEVLRVAEPASDRLPLAAEEIGEASSLVGPQDED